MEEASAEVLWITAHIILEEEMEALWRELQGGVAWGWVQEDLGCSDSQKGNERKPREVTRPVQAKNLSLRDVGWQENSHHSCLKEEAMAILLLRLKAFIANKVYLHT